jgi:hypothetical protein
MLLYSNKTCRSPNENAILGRIIAEVGWKSSLCENPDIKKKKK